MILISYISTFLVFAVSLYMAFAFNNKKQLGYISLASWFFLAIGMAHGLGAFYIFSYLDSGGSFNNSYIVYTNSNYWWIHSFLTLCLIFSFVFGWKLKIRRASSYVRVANRTYNLSVKQIFYFAIFIMILSFALRYLYVSAFGGFAKYLEYNRQIRSGVFEINNKFSFLQPFGALSYFASYMFFSLILRRYRVFSVSILFFISLIFSLYVSYSYAGRVGFLIFLGVFIITFLYSKKINLNFLLMIVLFSVPLSFFVIFNLSNFFNLKGGDSLSYFIIKEIGHLFSGFYIQLNEGYLYRGFLDFLMAPMHLLPSSWTSGLYETADQTNTRLLLGAIKGEDGVTGGIPVDILTLGIMQFNVFGVVFVGMLFGWFLKRLDYFLSLIKVIELRNVFLVYASLRISFMGALYAQPPHLMNGLFVLIFMFFVLYFFNVLSRVAYK